MIAFFPMYHNPAVTKYCSVQAFLPLPIFHVYHAQTYEALTDWLRVRFSVSAFFPLFKIFDIT